jgi:hypothetical protein
MGPMTGRAAGYCAGYSVPGYANPVGGRGFGFGRGFGRGRGGWGRRNWYYATGLTGWQRAAYGYPAGAAVPYATPYAGVPYAPIKEQQTDMLKGQAEYLEDQLAGIKKRLEELKAEKK